MADTMESKASDEDNFDQLEAGKEEPAITPHLSDAVTAQEAATPEAPSASAGDIRIATATLKNKEQLPVPEANATLEAPARLKVLQPGGISPINAVLVCKEDLSDDKDYDTSTTTYYLRPSSSQDSSFEKARTGLGDLESVAWSVDKLTTDDEKHVFEFTATGAALAVGNGAVSNGQPAMSAQATAPTSTSTASGDLQQEHPLFIQTGGSQLQDMANQFPSKKVRMQATRITGREHLPKPERKSDTPALLIIKDFTSAHAYQGSTVIKATKRNQQSDDWYHDILYPKAKHLEIDPSVLSWEVQAEPRLTITAYPGDPSATSAHAASRAAGGAAHKPARLHISKASMTKDDRQTLDEYMLSKVDTQSSVYSQMVDKALGVRVCIDGATFSDAVEVDVVVIKKLDTRPGKSTTWQYEIVLKGLPDFMQYLEKETTQWRLAGHMDVDTSQQILLLHAFPGKHQPRKRKHPGGEPVVPLFSSPHLLPRGVQGGVLMGLPLQTVASRGHMDARGWQTTSHSVSPAATGAYSQHDTRMEDAEQEAKVAGRRAQLDVAIASGNLTDDDLSLLLYHLWDLNEDGYVDVSELYQGLRHLSGLSEEWASSDIRTVLAAFNKLADKDGRLDESAFNSLLNSPEFQSHYEGGLREVLIKQGHHLTAHALSSLTAQTLTTLAAHTLQRAQDLGIEAQLPLVQQQLQLGLPVSHLLGHPSSSRHDANPTDSGAYPGQRSPTHLRSSGALSPSSQRALKARRLPNPTPSTAISASTAHNSHHHPSLAHNSAPHRLQDSQAQSPSIQRTRLARAPLNAQLRRLDAQLNTATSSGNTSSHPSGTFSPHHYDAVVAHIFDQAQKYDMPAKADDERPVQPTSSSLQPQEQGDQEGEEVGEQQPGVSGPHRAGSQAPLEGEAGEVGGAGDGQAAPPEGAEVEAAQRHAQDVAQQDIAMTHPDQEQADYNDGSPHHALAAGVVEQNGEGWTVERVERRFAAALNKLRGSYPADGSRLRPKEALSFPLGSQQGEWPDLPSGPAWVEMMHGSFTALKYLGASQSARSKVRQWLVTGGQMTHKAWYRGLALQWKISKSSKDMQRVRTFFDTQKTKWGMADSDDMWSGGSTLYSQVKLPAVPTDEGVELFMEAATALSDVGLDEEELQAILNRLLMLQPSEEDVAAFAGWVRESWSSDDVEAMVWALMSVRTVC